MEEQLVKFETAKLAKEKGFDFPSARFYCTDGVVRFDPFSIFYLDEDEVDELEKDSILINDGRCIVSLWEDRNLTIGNILAPTQSLLQKWLREEYKIEIKTAEEGGGYKSWYKKKDGKRWVHALGGYTHQLTYEEALEKALFEALKLIK